MTIIERRNWFNPNFDDSFSKIDFMKLIGIRVGH